MKHLSLSGLDFDATFEASKDSNDPSDPFVSVFLAIAEGPFTRWIDVTDLVGGLYYRDRRVTKDGFKTVYVSVESELQRCYHEHDS